jgi:hypothetical protein
MLKAIITWVKSTAALITAPIAVPPEDPRIAQFLDQFLSGELRAQYVGGRRVPLDLFCSRWRSLLLSDDPKTRNLVRSPTGFHCSLEIVSYTLPDHDEPPYLKPENDAEWHHWTITNWLFPPLTKQAAWEATLDETVMTLVKASRSGRIVYFYEHGVQVPPELFDSPYAILLFHPDPKQRARVKDRWGRGSRRKIITVTDPRLFNLPEPIALVPIDTLSRGS